MFTTKIVCMNKTNYNYMTLCFLLKVEMPSYTKFLDFVLGYFVTSKKENFKKYSMLIFSAIRMYKFFLQKI